MFLVFIVTRTVTATIGVISAFVQTSERLHFWAKFLCHFERFSSLNMDIVDFTGKFRARANMTLTTVPTRSFEAIKSSIKSNVFSSLIFLAGVVFFYLA